MGTERGVRPDRGWGAIVLLAVPLLGFVAGCSAEEKAGVTDLAALSSQLKSVGIGCTAPGPYVPPDPANAIGEAPGERMTCFSGQVPVLVARWDTSAAAGSAVAAIQMQSCIGTNPHLRYLTHDDWVAVIDSDGDVTHLHPKHAVGPGAMTREQVEAIAGRIDEATGAKYHSPNCGNN